MLLPEVTVSLWIWIAVSLVIGALCGAAGMALARRRNDAEQRLRRLRREFDQYQGEVGNHFSQMAEVLTRLRNDFSQLYNHTERAAAGLVGEEALQRRLRELEIGDGRHATPPPDRLPAVAAPPAQPAAGSPRPLIAAHGTAAEQGDTRRHEDRTASAAEVEPTAGTDASAETDTGHAKG